MPRHRPVFVTPVSTVGPTGPQGETGPQGPAGEVTLESLVEILQEGSNVSFVVDEEAGTLTIASTGGGGGGSLVVKVDNASVDTTVTTIDFGNGFDATESPEDEINVVLDLTEYTGGALPVAGGGTGATDAAGARTALGVAATSHTHAESDVTGLTAALAAKASTTDLTTHAADTTSVHGIADTSLLETTTGAQAKVDAHTSDATAAHAASAISYAGASGLSATDVEAALDELDAEKQPLDADLTVWGQRFAQRTASFADRMTLFESTGGGSNSLLLTPPTSLGGDITVTLPSSTGTLALASEVTDHVNDTVDAHDATAISYAGSAGLSATTVEAALDELDSEKAASSHTHAEGDVTGLTAALAAKQAQDAFLDDIAALTDPGADRILGWDETTNEVIWFSLGTGLAFSGTTLEATGGGGGGIGSVVEDTTPQLGGNLDLNGSTVGDATAADLTKLNAVTASAAELNILDGATLTVTELNHVDGVTSAIQTQLDGKAATGHNHTGTYQPLDAELTDLASKWIVASASASASLDLYEDTDGGSNFVRLTVPAALGGNRTVVLPDADTTLVGANATQTLTAKTIDLTSNTLVGSVAEFNAALESADFYTSGGTDVAVADGGTGASTAAAALTSLGAAAKAPANNVVAATGATETIDWNTEAHFLTMDQNCTFSFSNVPASGNTAVILVWLSGAFTPTWPAAVDYGDATPPTYTSPSLYVLATKDGGTSVLLAQVAKAIG
jgi:hypothetical protein